jgi:fatty acid-binding protein DegV
VHAQSTQVQSLITLVSDIETEFPLIVADMGPTVGTHGGPGLIALTWLEAPNDNHY